MLGPRSWWRHRRWTKAEARLIDSKFVRMVAHEGSQSYQVWDYMVEVPDAAGKPTRLVIRELPLSLDLPETGKLVPVLLNRKRTKAVFELNGSRIDFSGRVNREKKLQKARDAQRFEEKLRETGDA